MRSKKLLSLLLALVMVLSLLPVLPIAAEEAPPMKVALITDEGGPEDGGFNQQVHEAAKAWCEKHAITYATYVFEDSYNTDVENYGVPIVEKAIAEGATVLLLPGFSFTEPTAKTCKEHPDVTYILLDVDAYSLEEAGGEGWEIPANVYTATYREEQSAYLAGWAAVAMGYRKLGFLGGPDFPGIIRFGYGFVQGANDAAKALDCADDVSVRYVYTGQFMPEPTITALVDGWYKGGVEVVFACGGGIYVSAAEAAADNGGKIIGVDADQKDAIDGEFGEGITITSAIKNMGATAVLQLDALLAGTFEGGREELNGIVSAVPGENPVGLAPSTVYNESFTVEDYAALLAKIVCGELVISDDWSERPETDIAVFYQCYPACEYGDPTYEWAEDNSTVTAKLVCKDDDTHVYYETVKTTVETVEATCTEAGSAVYTAEFTDPAFEKQTKTVAIEAKGHTEGEAVKENAVAATCTEAGGYDTVVYCTVCGAELSREHTDEPALGHDIVVDEAVPATCTATGLTAGEHCTRCDYKVVQEEIPMTAHTYKDGVCTVCGAKDPDYKPPVAENPFNDVKEGDFYYDAVLWAVSADPQVTAGTSKTTFSPNDTCTRAQVVTFLWRAKGCPEPKSSNNPFSDVKEGEYYYKAVLWAVENEITAGTSKTTFSPNAGCTRAQVVTFLWRTEGQPKPTSSANPFKDVTGGYYYDAVLWAVEKNITAGTSATTFSPDNTCTRGQIVTFLYRAFAG